MMVNDGYPEFFISLRRHYFVLALIDTKDFTKQNVIFKYAWTVIANDASSILDLYLICMSSTLPVRLTDCYIKAVFYHIWPYLVPVQLKYSSSTREVCLSCTDSLIKVYFTHGSSRHFFIGSIVAVQYNDTKMMPQWHLKYSPSKAQWSLKYRFRHGSSTLQASYNDAVIPWYWPAKCRQMGYLNCVLEPCLKRYLRLHWALLGEYLRCHCGIILVSFYACDYHMPSWLCCQPTTHQQLACDNHKHKCISWGRPQA